MRTNGVHSSRAIRSQRATGAAAHAAICPPRDCQPQWPRLLRLGTRTGERDGEGKDAAAEGWEGDAAQVVLRQRKAGAT